MSGWTPNVYVEAPSEDEARVKVERLYKSGDILVTHAEKVEFHLREIFAAVPGKSSL